MKPFFRKKLPYILIALEAVLIAGILLYIVPGRFRLYDIVLYDAAEKVPKNPLIGYAPPAEQKRDCRRTDLVFIMLPFSEWEPEEGVFDTAGVEEKYHIEKYREHGKHAVLRFVCDIPSQEAHRDVPDWLCQVSGGREYEDASGKGYEPDYGDETFLKAHKEALDALAAWCNKDSFVSYVEIGSVGRKGDWNTLEQSGPDKVPSDEILLQYWEQYEEAFSEDEDILLLASAAAEVPAADTGSWKDVIGSGTEVNRWTISTLDKTSRPAQTPAPDSPVRQDPAAKESGQPAAGGELWTMAPVGGGLTEEIPVDTLLMDNLSDTLGQIRSSHISFIGPGCPDAEQQETNGSEMILRNVGYCLYLSRLQTTVDFIRDELLLHFTFNNIGNTPMYRDWPVTMYIYDREGNCIRTETLDLRLSELMPGGEITVTGSVLYSKSLLDGYSVGLGIASPDGKNHITFAQKGVLPDRNGIHLVYRYSKIR